MKIIDFLANMKWFCMRVAYVIFKNIILKFISLWVYMIYIINFYFYAINIHTFFNTYFYSNKN